MKNLLRKYCSPIAWIIIILILIVLWSYAVGEAITWVREII